MAVFEFGPFVLNLDALIAPSGSADAGAQDLRPAAVVSRATGAGRLKDELLQTVWPGTFVEEGNLTSKSSCCARSCADGQPEYISTVPRHGYRFVAEVRERPEYFRPLPPEAPTQPCARAGFAHR